ncbi:MAG: hypothetical protein AB1730_03870 [Myxococcota bacterium]|jgi:hypothetical protein
MSSAPEVLSRTLSRCEAALRAQPERRRDFEAWAVTTLDALVAAERQGRAALDLKLSSLRLEMLELERAAVCPDAPSLPEHVARREWLQAVLRVVDELMGGTPGGPEAAALPVGARPE